jgi:hypothetical protein
VIRRKTKMALAGRATVVEQVTPARLLSSRGNPPKAMRRRIVRTRVMKEMKRKPASRSSRKPLMPYALTGVHPYISLTANSKDGRVRSMPWSQWQILESRSSGPAHPSSLMRRITPTALP